MSLTLKTSFKVWTVFTCLVLINHISANSMLLGNLIGCNSFGCRIAALENDVNLLKQQVNRLNNDPTMSQGGMTNFRPNSYNQYGQNQQNQGTNFNQQSQQGLQGQLGQQSFQGLQDQRGQQGQQQNDSQGGNRVNQFAPDYQSYNQQQALRRVPGYPNNQLNGQFIN